MCLFLSVTRTTYIRVRFSFGCARWGERAPQWKEQINKTTHFVDGKALSLFSFLRHHISLLNFIIISKAYTRARWGWEVSETYGKSWKLWLSLRVKSFFSLILSLAQSNSACRRWKCNELCSNFIVFRIQISPSFSSQSKCYARYLRPAVGL